METAGRSGLPLFPLANRQFEYVSPPRAYRAAPGTAGQVVVFAISIAPAVLSLSALTFGQVYTATSATASQINGVVGNYLTVLSDAADSGIVLGPTLASVTGANAPVLATVGTVDVNGIYAGAAGTCHRIFAGALGLRFLPQPGQDLFMGIVGSGAGTVRIYQSSPANP